MLALLLICALLASSCIAKADELDLQPILDALDDPSIPVVGIHISIHHSKNPLDKEKILCEYCSKCPDFVNFPTDTNYKPCPERLEIFSDTVKPGDDHLNQGGDIYLSSYFGFTKTKLIHKWRMSRPGNYTPRESQILTPEMNVSLTKLNAVNLTHNQTYQASGVGDELSFVDELFDWNIVAGVPYFKEWEMGLPSFGRDMGFVTETLFVLKFIPNLPRKTVFLNQLQLAELTRVGCTCIRSKIDDFTGSIEELEELCRGALEVEREEFRAAARLYECTMEMKINDEKLQKSRTEL